MRREYPPDVAREMDERGDYPFELFRQMAELGWLGLPFPEAYGGQGGSPMDVAILVEELARGMLAAAQVFGAVTYVGGPILDIGNEEQRRRFLPPVCRGELHLALALTEPDSGSDAAALRTRAVRDGDVYRLRGTKMFCSRAHIADYVLVAARTDPDAPKRDGISLFLVPGKQDGLRANLVPKLGVKPIGTCEVVLEDAEVPVENRLGEENRGWDHLQNWPRQGAVLHGGHVDGGDRRGPRRGPPLRRTARAVRAADRPVPGHPAQARRHVHRPPGVAAHDLPGGLARGPGPGGRPGGLGGQGLHERGVHAGGAHQGMQIMGGYGYMMEFEMQRHFRDAKLMEIGGGTSEIHRTLIGTRIRDR